MRRLLTNLISVVFTFIKLLFMKVFHGCKLRFSALERFSPNTIIEVERKGKLILGKKVRLHSGGILKVRDNGCLIIGNNVFFNYRCMVFCKENITIDDGVEFGPDVKIYDHDHNFRVSGGIKEEKYLCSSVYIGKNAWIGANTVILRGSTIGENSVIAAGSVVKGDVPANSILIQKRSSEYIEIRK